VGPAITHIVHVAVLCRLRADTGTETRPRQVLDYSEAASQKMILTGFLDLYARKRKPI
jgi:hypothetical protein